MELFPGKLTKIESTLFGILSDMLSDFLSDRSPFCSGTKKRAILLLTSENQRLEETLHSLSFAVRILKAVFFIPLEPFS